MNWRLTKPSGEWRGPAWLHGLLILALLILACWEWW